MNQTRKVHKQTHKCAKGDKSYDLSFTAGFERTNAQGAQEDKSYDLLLNL